ncbi:hypothetical protein QGP82_00070 [Leptothoe sp. LEGE 181152]|nr:hypothetical protein [Leptothoe sp. LEGE 181152]
MEIILSTDISDLGKITTSSKSIIVNILNETLASIHEYEFSSRIGCSLDEFKELINDFRKWEKPRPSGEEYLKKGIKIVLPLEKWIIFSQAMNAICYGVNILNFEEKIGMKKNALRVILDDLLEWIDHYESSENSSGDAQ